MVLNVVLVQREEPMHLHRAQPQPQGDDDPLDPLALPGLSDLLEVQRAPRPETPVSDNTAAIHRYVHRHWRGFAHARGDGQRHRCGRSPSDVWSRTRCWRRGLRCAAVLEAVERRGRGRSHARYTRHGSGGDGSGRPLGYGAADIVRGQRHRAELRAGPARVRPLHTGRQQHEPEVWRKRARVGHLPPAVSSDGRRAVGALAAARRQHLLLHAARGCWTTTPSRSRRAFAQAVEKARAATAATRHDAASAAFTRSARTLPISSRPAPPGAVPNVELLAGCRVLVVDGQELTRSVLMEMLSYHGASLSCTPQPSGELELSVAPADFHLSAALSAWSRGHLDPRAGTCRRPSSTRTAWGCLRRCGGGSSTRWSARRAGARARWSRRVAPTNTTFVVLVSARQKRRYEEAVSTPRVLYLLKPFREPALIRVLTTPHTMLNTRQYDHPSRTSYPSVMTSTTHVQHHSHTVQPTPVHVYGAAAAEGRGGGRTAPTLSASAAAFPIRASVAAVPTAPVLRSGRVVLVHEQATATMGRPTRRPWTACALLTCHPLITQSPIVAFRPRLAGRAKPAAVGAAGVLVGLRLPGGERAERAAGREEADADVEPQRAGEPLLLTCTRRLELLCTLRERPQPPAGAAMESAAAEPLRHAGHCQGDRG